MRRVVVIGAGHQGLVAGIKLAERGHEVVILESATAPGGGVRSAELTLPGFVHDTCAGFFPLTLASPAFRALELDVDWVNPPVAMAHAFEDGSAMALHRDVEATAESVGAAWGSLMERLWPHREALVRAGLGRLPPVRPALRLLPMIDLAPMLIASSAAVGWGLFGNDRAAAWLAGSGAHADLSPHTRGSGAFALGLNFLAHMVGWGFPRGGAGRLTDALVERFGGELRCGAAVERIEVRGGRVRAVVLSSEDRIEADAVICTASPAVLTRLVPMRLRPWRYGVGTLKVDYALSAPVPWRASVAREAGVVHVGGPLGEIAESLEQAKAGIVPERPALVVGQHTLHDSSRAPAGQHTLYAYARVPNRAEPMADLVDQRIEQFAPGFRDLVLARSVRTPAAIEAENPSMHGGDLASGSCEPDQMLIFRPDPRLCRGRTPLRGLYVAGAWVHPGPGVNGMSGAAAADAVVADVRRRRL